MKYPLFLLLICFAVNADGQEARQKAIAKMNSVSFSGDDWVYFDHTPNYTVYQMNCDSVNYWRNRAIKAEMKITDLRDSISKCAQFKKDFWPVSAIDIHVTSGKGDSTTGVLGRILFDSVSPKYDTIPCIMLVCDTSYGFNYTGDTSFFYNFGYAKTVNGYKIIHRAFTPGENGIGVGVELIAYLDNKKKPLKRSIIVWQSK